MNDALRRSLARRHGLDPETATEEEVTAAETAANPDPAPEPEPEPTPTAGGDPEPEPTPEPEPAGVTARTTTISADVLRSLEQRAERGDAAAARQLAGDRDRLVLAALEDGRITPAESGLGEPDATTGLYAIAENGWRRDLEDAPEVTARALDRLERGKYPGAGARRGAAPQGEATNGDGAYNRARAGLGIRDRKPEGVTQ